MPINERMQLIILHAMYVTSTSDAERTEIENRIDMLWVRYATQHN